MIKKTYRKFEDFYVNHFLRPQFEFLGHGFTFMRPWHVQVFGSPIKLGHHANVIASSDMKVSLSVWSDKEDRSGITIGDYCLICPGVRIGSGSEITIGDNCMMASNAYIMDSDWHDIYNRITPGDSSAPVRIEENAWIGYGALVCKGVTIGRNSIIGAGAVVVSDVPPNSIAGGNPARVIRQLDPDMEFTTRAQWFSDPERLEREIDLLDRQTLKGNTLLHWLRYQLFPRKED